MDSPEEVKISINKDQALILFDFVTRLNKTGSNKCFVDQAEEKVLWVVEAQLEKVLIEPFMPEYQNRLNLAKRKVNEVDEK